MSGSGGSGPPEPDAPEPDSAGRFFGLDGRGAIYLSVLMSLKPIRPPSPRPSPPTPTPAGPGPLHMPMLVLGGRGGGEGGGEGEGDLGIRGAARPGDGWVGAAG